MRGEAPFASHLLYTQVLDDEDPKSRRMGIDAGIDWGAAAEARVVYEDLGVSPGMSKAIHYARIRLQLIEHRKLPAHLMAQLDSGEPLTRTEGAST